MTLSRTIALLLAGDLRQVAYHVTQARELHRGGAYDAVEEHLTKALVILHGQPRGN